MDAALLDAGNKKNNTLLYSRLRSGRVKAPLEHGKASQCVTILDNHKPMAGICL